MAETCIVCLGDLRTTLVEDPPEEEVAAAPSGDESKGVDAGAKTTSTSNPKSIEADDEAIAHLLPCKHDLHNSCLTPWVERANSCPICRTTFNMVEISRTVGGTVVDSYAVKDKTQEAEIDPNMILDDELFAVEAWEPCLICGTMDDGHGIMYCDGCDRAVHVFCAGLEDTPDVYYCTSCLADLENDTDLPGLATAARRRPGQRNRNRGNGNGNRAAPRRRRNPDAVWARVWQEVSRRLDLDLDFPFDEEPEDPRQTAETRREFRRWQERFDVANRMGATNRLRGIAEANLNAPLPPPEAESQDEIRAWNAFDKARESQDAPINVRRRKRRATQSPASPSESQQHIEQPAPKRPRLRRPPNANDRAESSSAAARRNAEEPTFLSSLLREVETKPVQANSPATSDQAYEQYSPRYTSPAHSPDPSEPGTPTAVTPPPHRPLSPPLSSTIIPATSPMAATFSPFSPTTMRDDADHSNGSPRGRRRRELDEREGLDNSSDDFRASSHSPSRGLSFPAKNEIQRMVKIALGSRYRDKEITKNQYTDINRDVSRKLYELVPSASSLADQNEREKLQEVANDAVRKAVAAIAAAANTSDEKTSD